MKHALTLAFFFFGIITYTSAQPTLMWARAYNGPPDNADRAVSIAVDAAGNSYVTGSAYAANGTLDIVTIKYDPIGQQVWLRSFNGSSNQNDQAVKLLLDNAGNVYVTGYTENLNSNHDITTIKYNANGVFQWAVYYDGALGGVDEASSMCLDAAGNVYVTGTETTSNNYTTDFVTLKYSPNGVLQWGHTYNGVGNFNDLATDIALDSAGSVYVLGTSDTIFNAQPNSDIVVLKYSNSGTFQWRREFDTPSHSFEYAKNIAVDRNSNVIVSGYGFVTGNGNDYFILKWDSAGTFDWFRNYNYAANTFEQPNALILDTLDNIIVTGQGIAPSSASTNDYVTVKYDTGGNLLWAARYNNIFHGEDRATSVALDDSLNIYVTGYSKGTGTNFDIATIKYDQAGNQQYVLRYNDAVANNDDMGGAIALRNGDIYVTGSSANVLNDDYITIRYSYGIPLATPDPGPVPQQLSVYPNPAHGEVHIALPEVSDNILLVLINAVGQVVPAEQQRESERSLLLNTAALAPGIYFLQVSQNDQPIGFSKLIVQ